MQGQTCSGCAAGAPRLHEVTLAAMPPGWVARACTSGDGGHLEPQLSDPRRALPPAEMSLERAREIVGACVAHVYYAMEIPGVERPPSLAEYSLRELLDANHRLAAENARVINMPGRHTTYVMCADRLIAALYVAHHFPPDWPDELPDGCEPVVSVGATHVLVMRGARKPEPVYG